MRLFALILLLCICSEMHAAQELLESTPNLSLEEAMFLLATHGYDVSGEGYVVLDGESVNIQGMIS